MNEGKQDDEWKGGENECKSVGRKETMDEGGREGGRTQIHTR